MAVSAKTVKFIRFISPSQNEPEITIHQEMEENEEEIPCKLCKKKFASDIALQNHAKLQHVDAFYAGDESVWRVMPEKPHVPSVPKINSRNIETEVDKQLIEMKTNEILSSMAPANLTSLASQDVSYIIIKSENEYVPVVRKKKTKRQKEKVGMSRKMEKTDSVETDSLPISGPFECLQPSEMSADGLCHQIFFSCCLYSEHFRDEHTKRQKRLCCQVCEKPLQHQHSNRQSQVRGKESHSPQDKLKFQCIVCDKRFTQQGAMKQHMRTHTGDRPFPCTYCPKSFTQKSSLELHLRIHTKEKPFRCVVCGKTFCQSVHLKQHMRIHTNLAPFQCGICQKRFKQHSHLKRHLKIHNVNNMTKEQKENYEKLIASDDAGVVEVEIVDSQLEENVEFVEEVESNSFSETNGHQWDGVVCEVVCGDEEQ